MRHRLELFVFFGLIATGKSTFAKAWAERHQMGYYNSDVVRKELAGLAPTTGRKTAIDRGIYSKDFSRRTYTALLERAAADLAAGRSVVLDASYQERAERRRVEELAAKLDARLYFIQCVCSEEVMKRRLAERALDPAAVSDGRWEIYLKQKERFEPPAELPPEQLITIHTDLAVAALMDKLENKLKD